eukprot:2606381-Pyramimonas_sp.AAC.1
MALALVHRSRHTGRAGRQWPSPPLGRKPAMIKKSRPAAFMMMTVMMLLLRLMMMMMMMTWMGLQLVQKN